MLFPIILDLEWFEKFEWPFFYDNIRSVPIARVSVCVVDVIRALVVASLNLISFPTCREKY
jgi:hypothetical protein